MKGSRLTLIIIALFLGMNSFACTCGRPISIEAIQIGEFEDSECVFIGEVLEVNTEEKSFKIKVIESFKGSDVETIYFGTYDEQCGPTIYEKGKWLIYGDLNDQNIIEVNECGLTRSFANPEYNAVIDGLIAKRLKSPVNMNDEKFIAEARKVFEDEIKKLQEKKKD